MTEENFGLTDEKNVYWSIHRNLDANYSTRSWVRIKYYEALKAITFLHKPSVESDNCSYCLESYPCQTMTLIRSSINA
jgi:hypothetical protein